MKPKESNTNSAAFNLDNVVDLYIRVSTTEQAEEGYSVGEQESRLRSYCEAYGYMINAVHIDPGYSGATLDRPGINKVINDVRSGYVKKVIVWKLDRLSRSQKDMLVLLEDVFLKMDVILFPLWKVLIQPHPLVVVSLGYWQLSPKWSGKI